MRGCIPRIHSMENIRDLMREKLFFPRKPVISGRGLGKRGAHLVIHRA